ncbi:MAG: hypothetical protein U9N61_03585 [Euryarchaeota archaeon]|nr:hypothetical protein [Euryarchaeota archaeon]
MQDPPHRKMVQRSFVCPWMVLWVGAVVVDVRGMFDWDNVWEKGFYYGGL